jgi:hypothetical protein
VAQGSQPGRSVGSGSGSGREPGGKREQRESRHGEVTFHKCPHEASFPSGVSRCYFVVAATPDINGQEAWVRFRGRGVI